MNNTLARLLKKRRQAYRNNVRCLMNGNKRREHYWYLIVLKLNEKIADHQMRYVGRLIEAPPRFVKQAMLPYNQSAAELVEKIQKRRGTTK